MIADRVVISNGWVLAEENETMDVEKAARILKTRAQRRYTVSQRNGDSAILTKHFYICPYCAYHVPAYSHYLDDCVHSADLEIGRTQWKTIDQWATMQMSIFPEDNPPLMLNHVILQSNKMECPKCRLTFPVNRRVSNRVKAHTAAQSEMFFILETHEQGI